jgi:predicted nucleotidyltransferase
MPELHQVLQEKNRIMETAKRYRAANVRIFGSVARGEQTEDSDIDFLVEFLPSATLLDQAALINALSSVLECKVDIVSERALNKHLRERVLREAIPL